MITTPRLFSESLRPHPATAWASSHLQGRVGAHWQASGALVLNYEIGSGLDALRVPAPRPPDPADGLWQHTCFEAFVAPSTGQTYHEYNFSPSGQWARYRFSAERVRDAAAEQEAPACALSIVCTVEADRLRLQVELPWVDLPPAPSGWLLGLSAVLEHADGRLSYWALHHPRAQPDFHHPAGRVLRLMPPTL